MTRLSIVIPCLDGAEQFEATLASVLQNRPPHCEILVLQPRAYDDPYDLATEVRFVEVPQTRSLVELINCGLRIARGDIFHVLSCDSEVTEGWAAPALAAFQSGTIGCVVPRIVDATDPVRTLALGLEMHSSGAARTVCRPPAATDSIVGPTFDAGFYRRQAVLDVGGFAPEFDADWAGLEAALRMHSVGYRSAVAEESVICSRHRRHDRAWSIRSGRQAERLFWRHAATRYRTAALFSHAAGVAGELAENCHRPRFWLHFVGRMLGAVEVARSERHPPQRGPAGRSLEACQPKPCDNSADLPALKRYPKSRAA